MSQRYFKQNGHLIKGFGITLPTRQEQFQKDEVTSLFNYDNSEPKGLTNRIYSATANLGIILNCLGQSFSLQIKKVVAKKLGTKRTKVWIYSSIAGYSVLSLAVLFTTFRATPGNITRYYAFTSKPLQIEETSNDVYAKDSRSQRINEVFKYYKCPLEGMGEIFVHEADKNNVPWWLVASVAFQESSCGKNTPKINGAETYNAWGWAVYGDNTHGFDNWARGVETVSKYMYERFYSKGVTDTCDIMKIYTPPSQGSWCEGVDYFGNIIQNYKSPTDEEIGIKPPTLTITTP